MPHHAELPPEETIADHAIPANDPNVINLHQATIDFEDEPEPEPEPMRTPPRFGHLALWMASASVLGIGVLGTVAYSMWFNHDQRVYTEAMASARKTLGIDQPAIAAQTQSAGVVEAPGMTPPPYAAGTGGTAAYGSSEEPQAPMDTATLADNAPTSDGTNETTLADASVGSVATGAAGLATAAAAASAQSAKSADTSRPAPPGRSANASRRATEPATQHGVHSRRPVQASAPARGRDACQTRRRPVRPNGCVLSSSELPTQCSKTSARGVFASLRRRSRVACAGTDAARRRRFAVSAVRPAASGLSGARDLLHVIAAGICRPGAGGGRTRGCSPRGRDFPAEHARRECAAPGRVS